ncbi:hypothetical protein M406DRAFT_342643 [Cryphonectria parasitica EP155]|uniref:NAD(P)-binding protein n=1 Tax=Cryphonectria parasitica (strain ATCC 38755 / EP155) TaxID=660469 RepID=A0A9P5CLM5_CRYP1|nr:uncharacterized protein M406DRAFT_342643 [Cryphonectria parasitica EP155]KAF3761975.1 hypothetical protein M406DRAFT_342643 [Cryphonectria parasitica EP155]
MSKPVAIIYGSGANVGAAITAKFLSAGYRVATVSRSPLPSAPADANTHVHIQADLKDPAAVSRIFAELSAAQGWPFPDVLIWNAYSVTPPSADDPTNPFAVPDAGFDADLDVMIKSPYLAAREAVRVWTAEGRKGTFIMTGNMLPKGVLPQSMLPVPVAGVTTLGIGKSGANFWVGTADEVFKEKGFRFFFADERNAEGEAIGVVPKGDSHAEMFLHLAQGPPDVPSYVTFVDGRYVSFEKK